MISTLEIEQKYEKAVLALPFFRQIAFAYCISKRLFPNYVRFAQKENFGNIDLLKNALELLKQMALQQEVFLQKIKNLINDIEAVIPDTEEFGGLDCSLALDSAVAIYESFLAISENNSKRLSSVAFIPFGSAEMQIQVQNLANHDLMLAEMRFQDELLENLKNAKNLDHLLA